MSYVANELLSRLVGCRLYSVQFVMDYLQLHFDNDSDDRPLLNCDVWPEVSIDGVAYREPDAGYADALRRLIPGIVMETREGAGEGLYLGFARGHLRLRPTLDEVYVEIAMLSGFRGGDWMVWRPGEDSFEHLR
jgi:hypothetical protein